MNTTRSQRRAFPSKPSRLTVVTAFWLCRAALLSAQTTLSLENEALRVELQPGDASAILVDKRTGVTWTLGAPGVLQIDQQAVAVRPRNGVQRVRDALRYTSEWGIEFQLRLLEDPAALECSFEGGLLPFNGPEIAEVRLLQNALPIGPGDDSYYAVPERMGVQLRAEGDTPFSRRMDAYRTGRGYSMAMLGAVQRDSALLVHWEAPETDLLLDYGAANPRQLTMGLALRGTARKVWLEPLGRGGYVEIAKAYRRDAERRGLVKTLAEKIRDNPALERLTGAAELKSFTLVRRLAHTRFNKTDQDELQLNSSFAEVGRHAAHMRGDLGLDRALLVVAGWIRRGYDNQHPDILPAAPETGGNDGLASCARTVRSLGWLFGLHDNYQDLYRDAPSWSEDDVVKNPDGTMQKGGEWVGGQTYLICSKRALDLIARPQNLPGVIELFHPDAYFIDCIFANPPRPCFDAGHPSTKADDVHYKQKLADFVRKQPLLMGGEEGYEWGVAHSDYFAGMLSHKTKTPRGAAAPVVIPLFKLVYGDSVLFYLNHRDRLRPDMPSYVLDLLLYGAMPGYVFGDYASWLSTQRDAPVKEAPDVRRVFARGDPRHPNERFIRNTYEALGPLNRLTALLPMTDHRFVTPDREVEASRFGTDVSIIVNYGPSDYTAGELVLPQYGFAVQSPTLLAFHARSYGGSKYREPTMFVLRSLDGLPLSSAKRIRIYRAFGDRRIEWNGRRWDVDTERVVSRTR
jgi:hypothetical protein